MRFIFGLLAVMLIFTGCVPKHPELTRDEWIKTTTRTYDKTPDEILNASEKLFRLADGDDFRFSHTQDSLYASRQWTVYLVLAAAMGTDFWNIKTFVEPNGKTKIAIQSSTQAGAIMPMATTGSAYSVGTLPTMGGTPVQGNSLYTLFFDRLEYLMGLRKEWTTCANSDEAIKTGKYWGINESLCNAFNIKDDLPEELRVSAPIK